MTREEKAQYCIDNPKKTPAFQFYPDCWWGSRHVAGMTVEERGIHASLIFSAWLEENCGIPESEICLSARVPDDKKILVEKVLSWCWFLHQCFWFCERLLNERIKQINLSNERHVAGSKGGRPLKSKISKRKAIDNQKVIFEKAKITKSEDEIEDEDEDRKEEENINKNTEKRIQGEKGVESEFETFWKAYPKKVGKGAAEKSWKKIKAQGETLGFIIRALVWQKQSEQWKKENGQFIPMPATYLNQTRWLDEPPKKTVSLESTYKPLPDISDEDREANATMARSEMEKLSSRIGKPIL